MLQTIALFQVAHAAKKLNIFNRILPAFAAWDAMIIFNQPPQESPGFIHGEECGVPFVVVGRGGSRNHSLDRYQ
jgi:hypothetical protein